MSIYKNFTSQEFENWVFEMDDKLDQFKKSLYGDIKTKMNYSISSLDFAERWLIDTYKTPDSVDALHRAITVDGFVKYIGEVFRKNLGGHWDMNFSNIADVATGPYITGFDNAGTIFKPFFEIKKLLEAKTGHHLKNRLLSMKKNSQE